MSLSTTFSCTVMYFFVMINQVLVQTFTAGEYNNGHGAVLRLTGFEKCPRWFFNGNSSHFNLVL